MSTGFDHLQRDAVHQLHTLLDEKRNNWEILARLLLDGENNYTSWCTRYEELLEVCRTDLNNDLLDQKNMLIDKIEKLLQRYEELCKILTLPMEMIGQYDEPLIKEEKNLRSIVNKLKLQPEERNAVIKIWLKRRIDLQI